MRLADSIGLRYSVRILLLVFLLVTLTLTLSVGVVALGTSENATTQSSPTAEFEITPSDPGPDEEFELDASMSEAPAGEITEYDWSVDESYSTGDWEGDSSLSGETITGEYSSYGDYNIELEITDNSGETDTITKTVTVDEERPTAEFEVTPSDPGPDEEFELDASMSEAPAGEITEYDWSVDESYSTGDWEGDSSLSGETITGEYSSYGDYDI
ncbi:PKD domain-containing protein, partial [Natronolimnohabitans sp. A-GB9]|uniref:PKD domain-containing protein n=1 Tax=Natronolimnohabitans sp. A-GB9 TaxID=3069757 RepID=UPI0027B7844B